jgi:hypothetical protein
MQDKIQEKVQQGWRIQGGFKSIWDALLCPLRFVVILYSMLRIRTVLRDPDPQHCPLEP